MQQLSNVDGFVRLNYPLKVDSDGTRTLALPDAFSYIRLTNATSNIITIPNQATVDWAHDSHIIFRRATGAGPVSFVIGAGVTVNNSDVANVIAGDCFAIKRVAANEWDFI